MKKNNIVSFELKNLQYNWSQWKINQLVLPKAIEYFTDNLLQILVFLLFGVILYYFTGSVIFGAAFGLIIGLIIGTAVSLWIVFSLPLRFKFISRPINLDFSHFKQL
jgi:preprotein translocase subunit SecF